MDGILMIGHHEDADVAVDLQDASGVVHIAGLCVGDTGDQYVEDTRVEVQGGLDVAVGENRLEIRFGDVVVSDSELRIIGECGRECCLTVLDGVVCVGCDGAHEIRLELCAALGNGKLQ